MRDINDIIQQNNDTWGPVIQNLTRQGRYVVAQYDGLHLVSIESFTTLRDAQEAAEKVSARVGSRSTLHFPLPPAFRAADHLARGPLQGDPDSFTYRQATRREEQRQANQSLTALQAAAPARPRDLSLETENTSRRVVGNMVDDLTREERDRVAEGGLVSQEV